MSENSRLLEDIREALGKCGNFNNIPYGIAFLCEKSYLEIIRLNKVLETIQSFPLEKSVKNPSLSVLEMMNIARKGLENK